jgi:hypothetical protein
MNYHDELLQKGFAVVEHVYSTTEADAMLAVIQRVHGDQQLFGRRRFLQDTPGLSKLVFTPALKKMLSELLPRCFAVKSIYFDKPPQANWFVSWHQDKIIFVKEKTEAFGFKNWTQKENESGVQPPAEYLGNIVTVRIHLDDTDATNGALKVIPYSHSEAGLRPAAVSFSDSDAQLCPVQRGGVMLMKPLLFHASSCSSTEQPRRVIHLEFCNLELPSGMEWAQKTIF